jgi:hypothetical protein
LTLGRCSSIAARLPQPACGHQERSTSRLLFASARSVRGLPAAESPRALFRATTTPVTWPGSGPGPSGRRQRADRDPRRQAGRVRRRATCRCATFTSPRTPGAAANSPRVIDQDSRSAHGWAALACRP